MIAHIKTQAKVVKYRYFTQYNLDIPVPKWDKTVGPAITIK
jgi:hypothetical protein